VVAGSGGGTSDIIARVAATELGRQLGQQVVVDNRPGSVGVIGAEIVVRAPADGYTIGYYGSTNHLSAELFKFMSGTQIVQVPYKTTQQVIADLIGDRVQLTFDNLASGLPHVKAGRLRALGVSSLTRLPAMPDLPTISEAGVPGFEVSTWSCVVAPLGVPKPIITKLNTEINQVLTSPVMKEKVAALGYGLVGGTQAQLDAFVKKEVVKWTDVIKRTGAKVD
jgi:tripartite-type tricarboxylate transporter receptor subunit TctC